MHTIKRGAKCHDIMDRVGNYWNQNLKLCLKNNGYTQETFAKAYKKQYGTGNQADVYRWLNVGNMSGSSGKRIGLPSYDTMKRIADFFHVTVGYLLVKLTTKHLKWSVHANISESPKKPEKFLKK